MKLFSKKHKRYRILKLFKIVDFKTATLFDLKGILNYSLSILEDAIGVSPNYYDVNYGEKEWRTSKAFLNGLKKYKNKDIVYLMAGYSDSRSHVLIDNPILNYSNPPNISSIDVSIAIESKFFLETKINEYLRNFYVIASFNYGYIIDLNEDYDFNDENKMSKGLFSTKTNTKESARIWQFHMLGIRYGYLKKLYPVNIINSSHKSQPVIKKLLEDGIGRLQRLNEDLDLWFLDSNSFIEANNHLRSSPYFIADEKSSYLFLESEDAKKFYAEMKLID